MTDQSHNSGGLQFCIALKESGDNNGSDSDRKCQIIIGRFGTRYIGPVDYTTGTVWTSNPPFTVEDLRDNMSVEEVVALLESPLYAEQPCAIVIKREDREVLHDPIMQLKVRHDGTQFNGLGAPVYKERADGTDPERPAVPTLNRNGVDATSVIRDSGEYSAVLEILVRTIEYANSLMNRKEFHGGNVIIPFQRTSVPKPTFTEIRFDRTGGGVAPIAK